MGFWVPVGLLMILLMIRTHVGVALGVSGMLGIYMAKGFDAAVGQLDTLTFHVPASYTFAVIPAFVFMGSLAFEGGFAAAAYRSGYRWFSNVPGGLAMATTLGSGAMSAASGSSVVNAAVFGRIAYPEMVSYGYDKRLSAGTVAASGTFAAMIPPSVTMVLFGIITGASIGDLLVAGILPGLLTVILYLAGIFLLVKFRPELGPRTNQTFTLREKIASLAGVWEIAAIFLFVMAGIYQGWFTPTQAGAVGAVGALIILAVTGRLSKGALWRALDSTVTTSASLFMIIIGGFLFSRFLTITGVVRSIVEATSNAELPRLAVLILVLLVYVLLGMFLDPGSMMVITLPITFPLLTELGYSPILIGILVVKVVEIAMITPPVGLNAYVLKGVLPTGSVSIGQIFQGLSFFLVLDVLTLAALIAFPEITLWLPSL